MSNTRLNAATNPPPIPRIADGSETAGARVERWEGAFARQRIVLLLLALGKSVGNVSPRRYRRDYYRAIGASLISSVWSWDPRPIERFLARNVWVRYGGYEYLLTPRALFGYYLHAFEPRTARDLLRRRGGVFIDCGANAGQYSVPLAGRFKEVVAVEPNPTAVAILRQNLARNHLTNVSVVERAVTPASGIARLYQGEVLTTWGLRDAAARYVDVDSVRLDELLLAHNHVDLLKLDIEGMEADVLLSASALSRVDSISFAGFPADLPRVRAHLRQFGLIVHIVPPLLGSVENYLADRSTVMDDGTD
ncbi:MAG: FkbM family methyltransferase [Thermoplasmata archaeon]|nr:FkbM family methyltransferase [Thermoplasmata archaeon]